MQRSSAALRGTLDLSFFGADSVYRPHWRILDLDMLESSNKLLMFRLLSAGMICLFACLSVFAQDRAIARADFQSDIKKIPPGNYQDTCVAVEIDGDRLRAACQKVNGSWVMSELRKFDACLAEITNEDGKLTCNLNTTGPARTYHDWEPTIQQFQHTAWGAKEGVPDQIQGLAQTEDGYLWLGTFGGLYRFDGLTFEPYAAPGKIEAVTCLRPSRGSGLWIGGDGRINFLKDENLRTYTTQDGVPNGIVLGFAEDREGAIWAATLGGLARLEGNRWKKVGEDWNFPGRLARSIFLDGEGSLWVATENTLVFLPSGAKAFQSTGIHVGSVFQIGQAPNGKLWMAEASGSVRPIPTGTGKLPPNETEIRVGSAGILFDRDGALWMTTLGDGLRRAPHPEQLRGKPDRFSSLVESFTVKDGLTDDFSIGRIIEDREGNIWVATNSGLDRFRKSNFVPVVLPVPLHVPIMVADDGGGLWLHGTKLWALIGGGRASTKGKGIEAPSELPREAYRDSVGTIWWLGLNKLYHFENGRFTEFLLPPALFYHDEDERIELARDRSGVFWIAAPNAGLFSMNNGSWKHYETPAGKERMTPTTAYTDWMGRVWFGYQEGTIIVVDGGNIQLISSFSNVESINGRGHHIWVGGGFGLAFYDGSRFQKVIPADAAAFEAVTVFAIQEDREGGLWFGLYPNVVHISDDEIQHFLRDPSYRVHRERFDSLDGLPGTFRRGWGTHDIQGTDGRLWFAASNGLAWLDPAHVSSNPLPPPISIRSLTADGKTYPYGTNSALPPLTKTLQIQFTALSLSIPERVRFRYRLDGFDKEWQDGGTHREVSYTNLSPRKYRFHVIACNNDGVWNETGATLSFTVLPAWYQTLWFRSLLVVVFTLVLWALYRLRLRQLTHEYNVRLEERVSERSRIAGELHDTLLQSFQGLMLRFQGANQILLSNPSEAKEALEGALDRADQALTESRRAIQGIRTDPFSDRDLEHWLRAIMNDLASDELLTKGERPTTSVVVEGKPRNIDPGVREEICKIAREAFQNALTHGDAHDIESEIAFSNGFLRVRFRDDGVGIDEVVLKEGVRAGHWGLTGMKERAKRLRGQLNIWSKPGAGTEVELKVPARVAFESGPFWIPFKKTFGETRSTYDQRA
jgi:signal transduction histidine kinase/ligand-binding sensor domain-containing protein